ncbi:MAG: hypothetical protein IT578_01020 [Verrucomicrobiae bacterium]|nr:hypothetical protein [Verrucomicrobiae bacterium]
MSDPEIPLRLRWVRDPSNPILPPRPGSSCDSTRCMNPWVVRFGGEYRLYYSGGDEAGRQRICLAVAKAERPSDFRRLGVVLDLGKAGAFDANWCVLPLVRRFGDRWHLYYTGNDGTERGLQSFRGIGLATSADGLRFERGSDEPIITGDHCREFPNNRGIAGGGTILEDRKPDGSVSYRLYYTVAVGTKNRDVRVDQEKHCAVCHSRDGIHWEDHRLIMSPRRDVASEDIAVAAPWVWRDGGWYRMLYCGIGTRWGFYSISEAWSRDGYVWERGKKNANLSLAPGAKGSWEEQMVEYPALVDEPGGRRLYYCGNGYGKTGIGTAVAALP